MNKNYEWKEPSAFYIEDIYSPFGADTKEVATAAAFVVAGPSLVTAAASALASIAAALTTIRGYAGRPVIYKNKKYVI